MIIRLGKLFIRKEVKSLQRNGNERGVSKLADEYLTHIAHRIRESRAHFDAENSSFMDSFTCGVSSGGWRVLSTNFELFFSSLSHLHQQFQSQFVCVHCGCLLGRGVKVFEWGVLAFIVCRYSYIAPHRQLTARFIMLIYIYIADCLHVNFRVIYLIYQWR